jgi:HK97 family phage prohead protease
MRTRQPGQSFALDVPPEISGLSRLFDVAPRISRREAMQVPAVLAGRNRICSTLASLPLKLHAPDRSLRDWPLFAQPDPDMPPVVTWALTYEDMLFEGVGWWEVLARRADGFPAEVQHVPALSVSPTPYPFTGQAGLVSPDMQFPENPNGVYVDGRFVPNRSIIRFDSPNPPLLVHAARAIRTCLRLDATASRYANEPIGIGYFKASDAAVDPFEDEDDPEAAVQSFLDGWAAARRRNAWGWVPPGVDLGDGVGFSPRDLQLADARQHAVLEIARAMGLDPEDLGVSTTSRTYQNQEDRRRDMLDFTLGAYISAVQDRLSMRDVTPRGSYARISFDGFLRSDINTRLSAYKLGREVGVYDDERIAELEDIPSATPSAPATPAPTIAAVPDQAATGDDPVTIRPLRSAQFDGADQEPLTMSFDAPGVAQSFKVDRETRVIRGLAVPWDAVARNYSGRWRFQKDSLHWSEPGRIKLNRDHFRADLIGKGLEFTSTDAGLEAAVKIARTPDGDQALALAEDGILDGFSIEIDFDEGDEYTPGDDGVNHVARATLRGLALTGTPAFDDARVTSVAATRHGKEGHMTDTKVDATKTAPPEGFDFGAYLKGLSDSVAESHKQLTTELGKSIGDSISAGFKAALESMPNPQGGPQEVRAARFTVTREDPVYRFNGVGNSLVRDAWYAAREHDHDAQERLRKYRAQQDDMAKLAAAAVTERFTTATTGNAGQIIPPGYRADLYVPQLAQGRPLVGMCSQGVIENATPFTVPVFVSATGATADHVEGTNPTDGTLSFGTKTVTPGGISGKLILTREIVDSSNPAIDQIALNTMRESYNQQTDAKVYTLLNGANGAGGTITSGLVPSGAQASTYVGTTGTPPAAIAGIRKELARYPFKRFAFPTMAAIGQNAAQIIAGAVDTAGRPMFPWQFGGPNNAAGVAQAGGYLIDNLLFVPAWSISGVAAGDSQILIQNQLDAWVWESPLLTFRFEEKSGPANIEMALFGYFGTHLLRPVGLSGIRLT